MGANLPHIRIHSIGVAEFEIPIRLVDEKAVQVGFHEPIAMEGVGITSEDAQFLVTQMADVLLVIYILWEQAVRQQMDGRNVEAHIFFADCTSFSFVGFLAGDLQAMHVKAMEAKEANNGENKAFHDISFLRFYSWR